MGMPVELKSMVARLKDEKFIEFLDPVEGRLFSGHGRLGEPLL